MHTTTSTVIKMMSRAATTLRMMIRREPKRKQNWFPFLIAAFCQSNDSINTCSYSSAGWSLSVHGSVHFQAHNWTCWGRSYWRWWSRSLPSRPQCGCSTPQCYQLLTRWLWCSFCCTWAGSGWGRSGVPSFLREQKQSRRCLKKTSCLVANWGWPGRPGRYLIEIPRICSFLHIRRTEIKKH